MLTHSSVLFLASGRETKCSKLMVNAETYTVQNTESDCVIEVTSMSTLHP